ncbi:hypothetical protein [Streptomyces tendae]|uniref:hypothetical protein n=1 Tax=Streptomyces tendae TaxID=1932 RepID=UPI00341BAA59
MTDQTTDRHTCHNQKAAAGPAWQCPRCSATPPVPLPPAVQSPIREQLLNAIDATFCQSLGYGTPEGLLAAYEASRTQAVDQAALRETLRRVLAEADGFSYDSLEPHDYQKHVDGVLAAVLPATTNHDTDTSAARPTTLHAIARHLEARADRIFRAESQASTEYHAVAAMLRRVADETAATETQPPATVRGEVADGFRALFGNVVLKGQDGDWANVADYIATGARIPACGSFYPSHTDTRCSLAKGHRGNHNAPWGTRTMAWPYDPRETQPAAGARQDGAPS